MLDEEEEEEEEEQEAEGEKETTARGRKIEQPARGPPRLRGWAASIPRTIPSVTARKRAKKKISNARVIEEHPRVECSAEPLSLEDTRHLLPLPPFPAALHSRAPLPSASAPPPFVPRFLVSPASLTVVLFSRRPR